MQRVFLVDFDDPSLAFEVEVGECVEVFAEYGGLQRNDNRVWVCRVVEIRSNEEFIAQWFCVANDVFGGDQLPTLEAISFDARELFLQPNGENDVVPVGTIYRKVKVAFCNADSIPTDTDYFVRFTYDERFHSFQDRDPRYSSGPKSVYNVLELYCGCGGFGFICGESDGIRMVPTHAVDFHQDSLDTYQLNHPQTKTHARKVDDFLANCRGFHGLCATYGAYLPREEPVAESSDAKILDLTGLESGKPLVGLRSPNGPPAEEYVPLADALEEGRITVGDVRGYLRRKKQEGVLPVPGEVDVIVGGPPCQGLSGKNRNVDTWDIFSCQRNSEIKNFVQAVEFFKPRFVVLENVAESMAREEGLYMRFAALNLIKLGYQLRMGILSAACYGAPQMRFRAFLIAALGGVEPLPPFPHPTVCPPENEFRTRANNLSKMAKPCVVDVDERRKGLLPPATLLWDALEDLPEVTSFDLTESVPYGMPAQRPYQCYLRMNEHDSEGWRGKAQLFLDVLYRDVLARIGNLRAICDAQHTPNGANLALGEYFQPFGALKQEVWNLYVRGKSPEEMAALNKVRDQVVQGAGQTIKALMDAFSTEYQGPCINHRCSPISVGAWLRIQMISKDGGDFTSLPGVVKHEEYVCVGHTHGFRRSTRNGKERILARCEGYTDGQNGAISRLSDRRCAAQTFMLPTKEVMITRWMVNQVNRRHANPRRTFGRLKRNDIFGTLLTEVSPSCGYAVIHPFQDRYISVREAARIQGFPDDYMFVARERLSSSTDKTAKNVASRFKQIGNSVSPPLASMIGRCIRRSAQERKAGKQPAVMHIPDPRWTEATRKATKPCFFYESGRVETVIEVSDFFDSDLGEDVDTD